MHKFTLTANSGERFQFCFSVYSVILFHTLKDHFISRMPVMVCICSNSNSVTIIYFRKFHFKDGGLVIIFQLTLHISMSLFMTLVDSLLENILFS